MGHRLRLPIVLILGFAWGSSWATDTDSAEAMVSALYGRDGTTCLRMYEYRGRGGDVSLDYTAGKARITQVDFNGRELGTVHSVFPITSWQIKTVKIERLVE